MQPQLTGFRQSGQSSTMASQAYDQHLPLLESGRVTVPYTVESSMRGSTGQGLWVSRGRPHRREFFVWATPPQKLCIRVLRGFPACSAYFDGGCFKTRINGLTERAETIYSQIKYFVKVLCEHVIRAFWHACYAQVALHMICKCNIDSGQSA